MAGADCEKFLPGTDRFPDENKYQLAGRDHFLFIIHRWAGTFRDRAGNGKERLAQRASDGSFVRVDYLCYIRLNKFSDRQGLAPLGYHRRSDLGIGSGIFGVFNQLSDSRKSWIIEVAYN